MLLVLEENLKYSFYSTVVCVCVCYSEISKAYNTNLSFENHFINRDGKQPININVRKCFLHNIKQFNFHYKSCIPLRNCMSRVNANICSLPPQQQQQKYGRVTETSPSNKWFSSLITGLQASLSASSVTLSVTLQKSMQRTTTEAKSCIWTNFLFTSCKYLGWSAQYKNYIRVKQHVSYSSLFKRQMRKWQVISVSTNVCTTIFTPVTAGNIQIF